MKLRSTSCEPARSYSANAAHATLPLATMTATQFSPAITEALSDLKQRFAEAYDRIHEVRVFGSVARGEAGPDSDVDVLIVLDCLRDQIEMIEVVKLVAGAGLDHDLLMEGVVMGRAELLRLRSLETAFVRALDREGVTV